MRTARPPPLQNPSRSAHGRLRIHRGLVQSPSPPFRPRLSFTDQLRKDSANRKSNRKPNTVHRNGVAPAIEEAFFVNYGFLPRETLALLHPRGAPRAWDPRMQAHAQDVLAFVRQHGRTHPKD